MQFQFNTDSSVMGTQDVATRIEAQVRQRIERFEDKLTRLEVHVRDENGRKGGGDDKACTIEARISGGAPVTVTANAGEVDAAARSAATKLAKLLERHFGKADKNRRAPSPDAVG